MCQTDRNCRSLVNHMVGGALDMPTNLGHFCHSLSSVFATISLNEREFQLSSEVVVQILCKQKTSCIQWLVRLYWLLLILNYELQTRSGTVLKGLWSSEAVLVKTNTKSLHKNLVYSVECTCWMCFSFGLNVFSVLGWAPCLATFSPDPAEAMNVGFLFFSSLGNEAQYYRLGCLISQARVNPAPTSNRKTYPSVFPGTHMPQLRKVVYEKYNLNRKHLTRLGGHCQPKTLTTLNIWNPPYTEDSSAYWIREKLCHLKLWLHWWTSTYTGTIVKTKNLNMLLNCF